ncbi:mitogen-activated protein kinase kinase [Sarracenia purpurea var. burkii]
MALVPDRRHLNLKLPLQEIADRRPRFPLSLPPVSTTTTSSAAVTAADIEKLHVLGHGNDGTVYKVRHKHTSAVYALKVVHGNTDSAIRRQVFREMEILRRTDSPFIVQCHGMFEKPGGDIAILMEYMDGGTLEAVLKTTGNFSEPSLATVARQVLNGLNYLHLDLALHRRRRRITNSGIILPSTAWSQSVRQAFFRYRRLLRFRRAASALAATTL